MNDKSYLIILDKNQENTDGIFSTFRFMLKDASIVYEDRISLAGQYLNIFKIDGSVDSWPNAFMGKCCSHCICSKNLHDNYFTSMLRKTCVEYLEV